MIATRRALRYLRLSRRLSLRDPPVRSRHLHTPPPNRSEDSSIHSPLLLAPPAVTIKPPVEEYVRQIREQYGDCLPAGLLEEGEYKLYERYYGRPTRLLQPGETLESDSDHFPPPKTPGEEDLYAQVAQRIAHPEGVKTEEGGQDHDNHFRAGSPNLFRTHPLTSIGRFATYPFAIQFPPSMKHRTKSVIANVPTSHLIDSAQATLGGSPFIHSPIYSKKRSKRELQIPLNPTTAQFSDMDAHVFLTALMPGLYAQCLSSLTELRRRLGSDWVLGGDRGEQGVRNVLDVGSGGAGVLAWRSIVEAEEERRRDELSERTGKPLPAGERSGLRAVVVTGSIALRRKVSQLLDDTIFIPRMPDIYFENLHHMPGVSTERNKAQPRKLYDLIIATNRLLPIVKSFYRHQVIEQLWSHLNPNGGVLLMIEKGTPMGFEAIASARSTILRNYIKDVGEAFQPPPTANAYGDPTDPSIEKEPGAIIAPCTNHEQCPLFAFGPTDGTRRKDYCRFPQRYVRPGYLQKLMNVKQSDKNHEDLEYSYVAFRRGADHRADTKNKINPAMEDFAPIPVDGEPATSILGPYTMPQLRNYSLTLPRIIVPPIKSHKHVTLDVCTPTGLVERWIVPWSLGKFEYRDARKSRWGDLWALGAKTRTKRNINIGGDGGKVMSKLVAIKDPHGDGVRAIVKDKTPVYLKNRKRKMKELKKATRLERKREAKERHAEKV
ncbi:unnamed protein product, partial [Tuber aestivum]